MTRTRGLTEALALIAAFAVSACAAETAYTAPANPYVSAVQYPYDCSYDLGNGCPPYVYGPPVVYGYDGFHHFDHLDQFHDHSIHAGHGLGSFGGHGFAGHGGFGFGGHGGVGRG
jgi:hypothetical protein